MKQHQLFLAFLATLKCATVKSSNVFNHKAIKCSFVFAFQTLNMHRFAFATNNLHRVFSFLLNSFNVPSFKAAEVIWEDLLVLFRLRNIRKKTRECWIASGRLQSRWVSLFKVILFAKTTKTLIIKATPSVSNSLKSTTWTRLIAPEFVLHLLVTLLTFSAQCLQTLTSLNVIAAQTLLLIPLTRTTIN